jgi:chemotaxis protein MotB
MGFPDVCPRPFARNQDQIHATTWPTQQNRIVVTGYTDNVSISPDLQREGIASNQVLSQKRADAVMQYLISQGLNPNLVAARGLGDADPVASNDTTLGRAKNRRVDLTLAGT